MGNSASSGLDPDIITAKELYNLYAVFRNYFLVVDCRNENEFLSSHIDTSIHHLNKLQNPCYNMQSKELAKFEAIVVYDGNIEKSNTSILAETCNKILRMKNRYHLSTLKVLKLEGGFNLYHSSYPFHCSDYPGYQHGMLFPSHIEDRVYLCGGGVATNIDVLKALKVTHIVNCTVDFPFVDEIPMVADGDTCALHFERLRIPVVDDRDSRIQDYFPEAVSFIDTALLQTSENVVLVHCKHGQSRSATILAAWLMATTALPLPTSNSQDIINNSNKPPKWTAQAAVAYLRSCRSVVRPNDGFLEQLEIWARSRG